MEKKKNNALEKAEKAEVKPKQKRTKKSKITAEKKKEQKLKIKEEKRAKRQQVLAEKKRIEAQKRVELAKIKAHKKAEKQKAKATRLREKNRRKMERKEQKARLKQERQIRKQEIKNQRKQQREKNKGFGGWLAAVISLGVATLVLASVLTFTFLTPSTNDTMLNANYERAFYDVIEQVDNIDLNLSKVLATKDTGSVQKYLVDTAINSELAESDIQILPLKDESKFYTAKLINQIGDYSKYLNNKLIDGERLTNSDREGLMQLYQANLSLKQALQKVESEMGGDYSFTALDNAKNDDLLLSTLDELENLSVQYPELIYDGPFSDGLLERKVKGISGEEISFDEAKEVFARAFNGYSFSKIEDVGETNAVINCYNIQGETDGELLFAQISKIGGNLIMFSYAGDCNNTVVSEEQAIENGQAFLEKLQIKNMQEVWINLTNNVYTINFAGESNGVIIYPDMIKVRVCAETGKVIGFEASEYYTNHTERNIPSPTISKETAKQKLIDNFVVKGIRKALVPIGTESERLCYEFYGEVNGQTYYAYIDAINGRQVQMFKVVEGTEGQFLM